MNDKKWLFFDIGGVVMSTNFSEIYKGFAGLANLDLDFVVDYHRKNFDSLMIGSISLDQFFEDMRAAGHNAHTTEQLQMMWKEAGHKFRLINEELMGWIKSNRENYHMATLTNLSPSRLLLDEDINLYEPFELNILSCVEGVAKPDLEIYQLALEKAGAKPEDAIFIDDREEYVAGAKVAGINDILYVDNNLLFAQLQELGVE